MPLVSGNKEGVYGSEVLKRFIDMLPPSNIPEEDIVVNFKSGITPTGLQVLKEMFHELVTRITAVSGTKTINIQEIIDPRGAKDLGCSAQQRYTDAMGYRIYTEASRLGQSVGLFVWLWNMDTELVYPLEDEDEADADDEDT